MKRAARRIVEKLRLHGHEAFFAGGWVRDLVLRRKPKDIDIATSALPEEVLILFSKSRSIGAQFGVVQVLMYGRTYEVATFRSDSSYIDGRHPSAISFCGPEEDALRRDFTINGLFYDPVADRLIDYVRGKHDIQNRLLRTIGDPGERFAEDKLRMLRAVRLSCELDFRIVPETWSAIQEHAGEILQVSWERIRDELVQLFTGRNPGTGLDLLRESGLLAYLLPEIQKMDGIPQTLESRSEIDVFTHTRTVLGMLRKPPVVLAFGALLHDVGKPPAYSPDESGTYDKHAQLGAAISAEICRRLRMSNQEINGVVDLVHFHMDFYKPGDMRKSDLKRLLKKENIGDHLELFRVNCLSNHKGLEIHSDYLKQLEAQKNEPAALPLITGTDLVEMGYSPGPIFTDILRAIEDLQLEGTLQTREEALMYVKMSFPRK
jgi:poly(A) polymerase